MVSRVVILISCILNLDWIVSSILTPTYYPLLKISSLHLVEPFLAAELEGVQNLFSSAAETSDKRRDIWPSSEEAFRSLKARSVMCTWDERVKRTFIVSFTL